MNRLMYDKRGWLLCSCNECGHLNYVETHGTVAMCAKCKRETEHSNIPYRYRDVSGMRLVRKPEREAI